MRKNMKLALAFSAALVIFIWLVSFKNLRAELHSQAIVQRLTQGGRPEQTVRTPDEQELWVKEIQQFKNVWNTRNERNVTPQVTTFLHHPNRDVRILAARTLGRLENPTAEEPLTQILQSEEARTSHAQIPIVLLKIALARIHTRTLNGTVRVQAVAESVGLSIHDLQRLSKRVNDPGFRFMTEGSDGDEIMNEIVDLLISMHEKGDNVDSLTKQLTLTPDQKLRIQAVSLPVEQQVKQILDYIDQRGAISADDAKLMERLVEIGPAANEQVIQRLEKMKQHPEQYRKGRGYVILFHTAAKMRDPRALALLKYFEHDADNWVSRYAVQARELLAQPLKSSHLSKLTKKSLTPAESESIATPNQKVHITH